MRHLLTVAAAVAALGFVASAQAQTYQAGSPTQVGSMCKVVTDQGGNDYFGYYAPCAPQAFAEEKKRK